MFDATQNDDDNISDNEMDMDADGDDFKVAPKTMRKAYGIDYRSLSQTEVEIETDARGRGVVASFVYPVRSSGSSTSSRRSTRSTASKLFELSGSKRSPSITSSVSRSPSSLHAAPRFTTKANTSFAAWRRAVNSMVAPDPFVRDILIPTDASTSGIDPEQQKENVQIWARFQELLAHNFVGSKKELNHMKCKKCKHEFCWVCMVIAHIVANEMTGPWSEIAWYSCNRYDEKAGVDTQDTQSRSRCLLVIHYNRWANHEQSAKVSRDLTNSGSERSTAVHIHAGSRPPTLDHDGSCWITMCHGGSHWITMGYGGSRRFMMDHDIRQNMLIVSLGERTTEGAKNEHSHFRCWQMMDHIPKLVGTIQTPHSEAD
ncbi:hypothetical protein F5887DRAFT_918333 [Amanita rubescens]|nr:hypothetical protein F5887DRAFT_923092 [Amanita rubescens]KAF8343744.1 hypothetical protein F5887DRAFT_918333 [Amanita rubescens]